MKNINLILPAQAVKMGGELGAVLGQHGVNIVKFCKDFNEQSKMYEYNLSIRINLEVDDSNNFTIQFIGPVSTFLIQHFSINKQIKLLDIYKIILIQKHLKNKNEIYSLFKTLLSTIKSMRYTIIYE